MSVPKSKRGESHMMVVTKANELASYTIHICSSEKNFPKRYRWCLTSKIVDASTDICNYVNMANNVYVNNQMTADLRSEYQSRALASTHSLLTMMNIAYQEFDIGDINIEHWTGLVLEVQNLIKAWKKSDNERYSNTLTVVE